MSSPDVPGVDDPDVDRWLRERLEAAVQDVEAGDALRDRIRRDVDTEPRASTRGGRTGRRWVPAVATAAAVIVILAAIAVEGDQAERNEVATGDVLDAALVARGVTDGEAWSVVEYQEDDAEVVDEPSTCLRFEPPIEDGPFFCAAHSILGAHGRLVLRPGRFEGLAVFAGVFSSDVAEVVLTIRGEQHTVAPSPWADGTLGVAVIVTSLADDSRWDVELRDIDGAVLTAGGGTRTAPPPVTERQEEAEQQRAGEHRQEAVERDRLDREEARRQAEAAAADRVGTDTPQASGGVSGPLMYWRQDDGLAYEEAGIEGVLEHSDGCLYVRSSNEPSRRHPLLWQFGTRWLPDLTAVLLPDGSVVLPGDVISGVGGFHDPDSLEHFTTDAAVLAHVGQCATPTDGDIAVLQGPAPSMRAQ